MKNIRIKASYEDDSPAAGECLHIGYGGMEQELMADEKGMVELDEVPAGIPIYVYQLTGGRRRSFQEFELDGRLEYEVKLEGKGEPGNEPGSRAPQGPAVPMTLQFVDPLGKNVPNLVVELSYDGKSQAIRSDGEGKIVLRGVPFGKEIVVVAKSDSLIYKGSFQHQENIDCHLIPLRRTGWKLW